MASGTGNIRDPQSLRAIAHPIRLRLYEALVAGGPATAARLARDVPGAPGSLSYHLRQLAAHGYIEEARELASDGRERWWRAVPGGSHWSDEDLDRSPGTREAFAAAQSVFLGRREERVRNWVYRDAQRYDRAWRSAAVSTDAVLHLSADELTDLGHELEEVLERWVNRSRANRQEDVATRRRRAAPREAEAAGDSDTSTAHREPGTETLPAGTLEQRQPVFLALHAFPFGLGTDDPDPAAGTAAQS